MPKVNLRQYKSMSQQAKDSLYHTVYSVYIEDNLSSVDTCKKTNISSTVLDALKRDYNMRKSRELVTKCMQVTCQSKFGTPYYDVAEPNRITIEKFKHLDDEAKNKIISEFKHQYIDEQLSIESAAKKCNISTTFAQYLISYADLSKTTSEIRASIIVTTRSRYGVDSAMQSEAIKDKVKHTVSERYGVDHVMQSSEIRDRYKASIVDRYGVACTFNDNECRLKSRNTMKERYGVEYTGQSAELRDKMQSTCLERYGVPNYMQSEESRIKFVLDYYVNRSNIPESSYKLLLDKSALLEFILNQPRANRTYVKLAHILQVPESSFNQIVHRYQLNDYITYMYGKFNAEQELADWLSTMTCVDVHNRKILNSKEIDIYLPKYHVGVEYNGNYWHSTQLLGDSKYHQKKSLQAQENGVFLYHIFEYEWLDTLKRDIIKSQLKYLCHAVNRRLYARNCDVCVIASNEAKQFLAQNHLQGFRSSSVYLGLRLRNSDELVSVMSFGSAYLSRHCDCWELHRFCNKLNTSVVGAFSKLFKYFEKHYQPKELITFSDYSKGSGSIYQNSGFECLGLTDPNYVWVNSSNSVLSRYQTQMKNEVYEMQLKGYMQIHDAGNYKWVYKFK